MARIIPPRVEVQSPGKALHSSLSSPTGNLEMGKDGTIFDGNGISNQSTLQKQFLTKTLSSQNAELSSQPSSPVESRTSQQEGDPLTMALNERVRMDNTKLRGSEVEGGEPLSPFTLTPSRLLPDPSMVKVDSLAPTKEKKNRVSFLSRFGGSKKKDAPEATIVDNESESGGPRLAGIDADIFSQPIEYIPKFPAPPKYIKVSAKGKKERDFNRVFLAQELRGRTGAEIAQAGGRRLMKSSSMLPTALAKKGSAVWKMEFSKDGKFLAAGGYDNVVRVWAVIATHEGRIAHEREEISNQEGSGTRLSAPVFHTKPAQEYQGHTAGVLDLCWSKNNFLLSSSMDRTVRLWHSSRSECLCCFKHADIVTSIAFHPRDDRFFLAGSLDSKLRLWSIPDKSVAHANQANDIITAVAFTPDGKTAIAGCLSGLCLFYETEGLRYQTQMHVRSAHGKNARGSKVTGIQAIHLPPGDPRGEVKLLITSNDSRIRLYDLRDKGLEMKLRGNENSSSQIQATFSDDAKYIICGSEDKKTYIWSTGPPEKEKDKQPLELFEAHGAPVTSAIMAPTKTRQLLQYSGDPLYDLCNPPPVTLVSRQDSYSSARSSENGILPAQPITPSIEGNSRAPTKPEESPAYIARSAHSDGSIIVTADLVGRIKVWRKDCAFEKRLKSEAWETNVGGSSSFSKRIRNRNSSLDTKGSARNSLTHPSSDRIIDWRQAIERGSTTGPSSIASNQDLPSRTSFIRTPSPRKSAATTPNAPRFPSQASSPHLLSANASSVSQKPTSSDQPRRLTNLLQATDSNPMLIIDDTSYAFMNKDAYLSQAAGSAITRPRTQDAEGNEMQPRRSHDCDNRASPHPQIEAGDHDIDGGSMHSARSVLSSEEAETDADDAVRCRRCGGESFRARTKAGEKRLECVACGTLAE